MLQFRPLQPTDLIRGSADGDLVVLIHGIPVALVSAERRNGSCWLYPLGTEPNRPWRFARVAEMTRFPTRAAALAHCHEKYRGRLMRVS